jgi:uncharacterized protein (DUF433 family)
MGVKEMSGTIDLLARPVYGMAQVDWILRLPGGTARRWIDGYARGGKTYPPLVRLDRTEDELVTWGEFTETRLLSEFRESGVPIVRMRPAIVALREQFNQLYPLAHALPYLEEHGRELVLRIQEQVGLEKQLQIVVVRNGQLALTTQTDQFIRSVDFADQPVVQRMHPLPDLDLVWLDPLRQFGEPVVRSVPTAVIAEQARAGDSQDLIESLYNLNSQEVWQAIRYELLRGAAATAA